MKITEARTKTKKTTTENKHIIIIYINNKLYIILFKKMERTKKN